MDSNRFNQGFALLIGVGETPNDKNLTLALSVNEAQAIRKVLVDPNYCGYPNKNIDSHVRLLCNESACKESILSELALLKDRCAKVANATAIIYFSGHGWSGASGQFGLIPSDVNTPLEESQETIILAEEFAAAIAAINAKRLLVVLECCHAGGMGARSDLFPQLMRSPTDAYFDLAAKLQVGEGRCTISSCTRDQLSYFSYDDEIGIFTQCFIDALKGAATPDSEQVVSISNVINHLNATVPKAVMQKYQKQQTPYVNYQGVDFPVAVRNTAMQSSSENFRATPPELIKNPNRRAVRMLLQSLSETEFANFASDHYTEFYKELPKEMLLSDRCRKLLDHCESRGHIGEMLKKLEQDFPDIYRLHEDKLFHNGT